MTSPFCDGLDRRGFLRVGSVAGLSLANVLRLQAAQADPANARRRDVNCIFIFILGGMPHQDMWDFKPNAPAELRGDFHAINTNVPGIQLTDLLPHTAGVTDKLAILRSLTHGDSDHGRGFHIMMTGNIPGPGDFNATKNNNVHPSLGSMVARMSNWAETLPPYISVPCFLHSGGPAFLGPACAPFVIETDPASPEFAVRDVVLPEGVTGDRAQRRRDALYELDRFERSVDSLSRDERALDSFYERSYRLMTSARAREAFDLRREQNTVRERYGMTSLGQCCLLGRRLVEAGCRFVSIENGHWDTHRENTRSLRDLLVPSFDRALATLVADLDERGMLDSTLVVVTTEFGRTPRINNMAGRDHWPQAFSIVMAGGGIRRGITLGATDRIAASVTDRPITPGDMAATILHAVGIDAATTLHTPLGRPVELASGGRVVTELFA